MPITHKPQIFISHAWEDKPFVRRLEAALKTSADIEVWIDHSNIRAGDRISRRVSDALEWCNTLLLVWSNKASSSSWVELEWNAAVNLHKTVIPCLLDETKLPAIISGMAYISFINFDAGITYLFKTFNIDTQEGALKWENPSQEVSKSQDLMIDQVTDFEFKKIVESGSENKLLMIDSRPLMGESKGKVWKIIYDEYSSLLDLLNRTWFFISPKVQPYTYGKKWALREPRSEIILFKDIIEKALMNDMTYENLIRLASFSALQEVGIKPGMILEIVPL